MWAKRCYSDLPDCIPPLLEACNRVPSWRAIAVAIMKNDAKLRSIGFSDAEPAWVYRMLVEKRRRESRQGDLFTDITG